MNPKKHLLSIITGAGIGGLLGYVFSYLSAFNQLLPETTEQYAHSLGIAGLTAGIISGIMPILIPYVLMPMILKTKIVRKIARTSRILRKILEFFSNQE